MELVIIRKYFGETFTAGDLFLDGKLLCNTLEDTTRPAGSPKIDGKTSIPYGVYKVILSLSKRFGKLMPEVLNVPGFSGIRIHSGNTEADTRGCPLVGIRGPSPKEIYNSRATFVVLIEHLTKAYDAHEEIILTIKSVG